MRHVAERRDIRQLYRSLEVHGVEPRVEDEALKGFRNAWKRPEWPPKRNQKLRKRMKTHENA